MTDHDDILAAPELEGLVLTLGTDADGAVAIVAYPPPTPAQRTVLEGNRPAIIRAIEREEAEALLRLSPHRLTDAGNAERLVERYGRVLRHCRSFKRGWLVWDEQRGLWQRNADLDVLNLSKRTIRGLLRLATKMGDPLLAQEVEKHARKSEARNRLDAMTYLAQAEPEVTVAAAALDADRWSLTAANGTVELRTGQLRRSRPADLATRTTPIAYDPAAVCPRFDAFLAEILPDPEVRTFLQRLVGKALAGDVGEQIFTLFWGGGANGKSTLEAVLLALFGDYGMVAAADTFLSEERGRIRQDLAVLAGARLVVAHETGDGRLLNEPLVKQMTGGDPITCRFLYGLEFTYLPLYTPILITNYKPFIRGTDHAIWRRLRLVEFGVTIPDDRQDRGLGDALLTELPGVLAWAVRGCLDWQRDGLTVPAAVREATASYRDESDVIAHFLAECCVVTPAARVSSARLYHAYRDWTEASGGQPMGLRRLREELIRRGCRPPARATSGPENGLMVWFGMGLRHPEPDGPTDTAREKGGKGGHSETFPSTAVLEAEFPLNQGDFDHKNGSARETPETSSLPPFSSLLRPYTHDGGDRRPPSRSGRPGEVLLDEEEA